MNGSRILRCSFALAAAWAAWATAAQAVEVNAIMGALMETKNIPGTTITLNGGSAMFDLDDNTNIGGGTPDLPAIAFASGDDFTLTETGMFDPDGSNSFDQNRHEFLFSSDGGLTPLTLDNSEPWVVSLDITISSAFANPRKSFLFQLIDSNLGNSGGPTSNLNLTTSRTPANVPNGGANLPPGESAQFGGQFNLERIIGPCDAGAGCNPMADSNPPPPEGTGVGYVAGTKVHMRMEHVPSPDDGITPARFVYTYDDGSAGGPYTNTRQDLRNNDATEGFQFTDGYKLGFVLSGVAEASFGTDSYTIAIEDLIVQIGAVAENADFDGSTTVDGGDFLTWQRGFGTGSGASLTEGDANGDGAVDGADLSIWQQQFGLSPANAANQSIPEPGGIALAALGAAFVVAARRRHS